MNYRKPTYNCLLVAVSAVLAFSGCADVEPDVKVPMTFSFSSDQESRATEPLDGDNYTVWASAIHPTNGSFVYYFNTQPAHPLLLDYVDNKLVASGYFYPLIGSLDMLAIGANKSGENFVYNKTTITDQNGKFTRINADLSSSDGTNEIIYSDITTVNCPVASNYTAPLHFHRPSAALSFNFIPNDKNSCSHVHIDKIEIANVTWQGTLTVNYNSDGTSMTPSWKVSQNPTTKSIVFSSDQWMGWDTESNTPKPLVSNLFLTKTVSSRPKIIIHYTMYNDSPQSGNLTEDDNNVRILRYFIDADPNASWNLQTQYIYNITVYGNCQMDLTNIDVKEAVEGKTGTMNI